MERQTMYMLLGGAAVLGVGAYLISRKTTITVVSSAGQSQGTALNLPLNTPLPFAITLPVAYTTPAEVKMANGASVPAGTVLPAGTVIPAGTLLPAGFVLPQGFALPGMPGQPAA